MANADSKTSPEETLALLKKMGGKAPWVRSFHGLHQATMGDGSLDTKTKELMSLAIGITTGCEDCIALHFEGARQHGASPEEILETIGVAVTMGGGPALMYGLKAYKRLDSES